MATYKKITAPISIKDLDVREMANQVASKENKMVATLCSEILRNSLKAMIVISSAKSQQ
jgi:hypothetical protein